MRERGGRDEQGGTGRERERGKIRSPPNLCDSYTELSCESPESVSRSVTRFRIIAIIETIHR